MATLLDPDCDPLASSGVRLCSEPQSPRDLDRSPGPRIGIAKYVDAALSHLGSRFDCLFKRGQKARSVTHKNVNYTRNGKLPADPGLGH